MKPRHKKILIIQTAFLGDVVLATSALESLHAALPDAELHFLLRKGNESLLTEHPFLAKLWILDKKEKWKNTWRMIRNLRKEKYDVVINFQRFLTSGLITAFSGGRDLRGFRKNPVSFLFNKRVPHQIDINSKLHEIDRNYLLFNDLSSKLLRPALYPSEAVFNKLPEVTGDYICIAPASVWFTKQWPAEKWAAFLNEIRIPLTVFVLGAPGDKEVAVKVISETNNSQLTMIDMTGKLSLPGSAAMMQGARMNYVNDSAPLHMASAVNAPVTAVFCSTVPAFGFTPLSDNAAVIETDEMLACRPCGLHGYRKCPEGHFRCALGIDHHLLTDRL